MAWKVKFCQSTSNKKVFIPLCTSSKLDSINIVWHNTFHQFGSYCRWKNTYGSSCTRRFAIESQVRHQSEWKSRKRIAFLILSESELVGWSESRNLELFYYLGHNYLLTFHDLMFKTDWFWSFSSWCEPVQQTTSHPEARDGHHFPCSAMVSLNGSCQRSRTAAVEGTWGDEVL